MKATISERNQGDNGRGQLLLPHTTYFVCGTERGGTGLLCEALRNTGLAGAPTEHFMRADEPEWAARWSVSTEYPEYVYAAIRHSMTPNGVFGTKLMWSGFTRFVVKLGLALGVRPTGSALWFGRKLTRHRADAYRALLARLRDYPRLAPEETAEFLAATFPNLHYIWITRRDKVAQAVSGEKLAQTGLAWKFRDEHYREPPKLEFNFRRIDQRVRYFTAQELGWQNYFNTYNITPFRVVYEEFAQEYEETTRRALAYLGVLVPTQLGLAARRMEKQADAISAEWIQRYHEMKARQ